MHVRFFALLVTLAVLVSMAGCATASNDAPAGGVKDVKVGGSTQIRGNYYR